MAVHVETQCVHNVPDTGVGLFAEFGQRPLVAVRCVQRGCVAAYSGFFADTRIPPILKKRWKRVNQSCSDHGEAGLGTGGLQLGAIVGSALPRAAHDGSRQRVFGCQNQRTAARFENARDLAQPRPWVREMFEDPAGREHNRSSRRRRACASCRRPRTRGDRSSCCGVRGGAFPVTDRIQTIVLPGAPA